MSVAMRIPSHVQRRHRILFRNNVDLYLYSTRVQWCFLRTLRVAAAAYFKQKALRHDASNNNGVADRELYVIGLLQR